MAHCRAWRRLDPTLLVDRLVEPVCVCDVDLRVLCLTPWAERHLARSAAELVGQPLEACADAAFCAAVRAVFTSGTARTQQLATPTGPVSAQLLPLPGADGAPVQVLIQACSDQGLEIFQERCDQILAQNKELLQSILDHAPALISIRDQQGRLVVVNQVFALLVGPDPDRWLGQTPADIFDSSTAADLMADDRRVIEGGEPIKREQVFTHRDGTRHLYYAISFPHYDATQHCSGGITVVSRPGIGSSFSCYLPLSDEPCPPASERAWVGHQAPFAATVLVVEDDPVIQVMALSMLDELGYQVLTSNDGVQAIEMIDRHSALIDVVLLDMIMPRLGGLAVFEHLRQHDSTIPVLIASGYCTSKEAQAILDQPETDYLAKPYRRDQLAEKIRRLLGAVGPRDRSAARLAVRASDS